MVPTLLALFWREGWGNSDYGAKKWKWRACIGVSHANVTGALADFGLGRISPKCVDGVVMSFHPNRVQNRHSVGDPGLRRLHSVCSGNVL